MNNENNQEPQLTPIVDNTNTNAEQINSTSASNATNVELANATSINQAGTNNIKSIDPQLNDKVKTESGARIDTVSGTTPQIHTEAFETEHKKKEVKTGTHDGPSKGLSVALIIFFVLLIAFVFFLPNISDYARGLLEKNNEAEITTGKLICKFSRTSDKLNFDYTRTFEFSDKALFKYTNKEEVTGTKEDNAELTKLYNTCVNLEKASSTIKGVSLSCNFLDTKFTQTEIFNYSEIGDDNSKTKIAYTEGGGSYPEFKYNENIDDVEVALKQAGYTCEKIK